MTTRLLVLGFCLMIKAAAVPQTLWTHPDKAYWSGGGILDINGDATRDVVVSAGDRNAAFVGFIPGSPASAVNMNGDYYEPPLPQLLALDGATGTPLWQVLWDAQNPLPPPEMRERFTLLEGTFTGNIDGSSPNQLLVQRSVYKAKPQGQAHSFSLADGALLYTTMSNPQDGAVIWETQTQTPPNEGAFRMLYLTDVLGAPGAVESSVAFTSPPTYTSTIRVIRFHPGAPPTTVLELPSERGTITIPLALPYQGKLRVFLIVQHFPSGQTDVRAVDISFDDTGNAVASEAWLLTDYFCKTCGFAPTAWGFPAAVTTGSKPLLLIGEGPLFAFDVEDGHELWRSIADGASLPPGKGRLITADVNGDGVADGVFTSWAPPPPGLLLFPYVAAVDGRNGSRLWRSHELTGEGWGYSLNLSDIDGDGDQEAVITNTAADAFPLTTQPFDDQGKVGIFDLATGEQQCSFQTERLALLTLSGNLQSAPGDEVIAPTVGGFIYTFDQLARAPTPRAPAPPMQVSSIVSRKTHGDGSTHEVNLQAGEIECRSGRATGEYTIVFTFSNALNSPLDYVNGARITSGNAEISDNRIDPAAPHQYIVQLTAVANAQTVVVSLTNVRDMAGNFSSSVSASMGVLVGDINGSGVVTSGDANLCKAQALQLVTNDNFRNDVNASGAITSGDVNIIKQNALTQLPP